MRPATPGSGIVATRRNGESARSECGRTTRRRSRHTARIGRTKESSPTVRCEGEGLLRARLDAELARVTVRAADDVGLSIAVRPRLQLAEQRQRRAVVAGEATDLEDVVGTDADAVFLRLAAVAVDDGSHASGLALALALQGARFRHAAARRGAWASRAAAN